MVVGDNGPPRFVVPSGPLSHSKGTTYDAGIHVSLVARWPGCPAGVKVTNLTHAVDVPAAVLKLCGLPIPSEWDGVVTGRRDHILSESISGSSKGVDQCARTVRWKLRRDNNREQFFDLSTDSGELSPLSAPPRSVVNALRAILDNT
jgi:hypothetical protein